MYKSYSNQNTYFDYDEDFICDNGTFEPIDIQQGIILANKWRDVSKCELMLLKNDVDIFYTSQQIELFVPLVGSNVEFIIFDGGAMSRTGNLAYIFPKVDSIISNENRYKSYSSAWELKYNMSGLAEIIGAKTIVNPKDIFDLCLNDFWKVDDFFKIYTKIA